MGCSAVLVLSVFKTRSIITLQNHSISKTEKVRWEGHGQKPNVYIFRQLHPYGM